ncbi:MAG TPA: Hpt domain-containing protein, partial [Candidatus Omnitrophota bacterium]|nr:Hpt domain-containing protein [Candidatus Omnitrophota bacterium]
MGQSEYDKIPKEIRDFIPDFLAESEENLRILNEKLLECEEALKQNKAISSENLNSLFRAAHSIKGTASFVGVDKIVRLTHKLETVLQKIRDYELDFRADIFDILFIAFDCLAKLLLELKEKKAGGVDLQPVMGRLEGVLLGQEETPVSPALKQQASSLSGQDFLSDEVILTSCQELVLRLRKKMTSDEGGEQQPVWNDLLMIVQQLFRFAVLLNSSVLEEMVRK